LEKSKKKFTRRSRTARSIQKCNKKGTLIKNCGVRFLTRGSVPKGQVHSTRLPSPTQINSSVSLSFRPSSTFKFSAENRLGPTDSINKYVKIVNRRGIVSQIFFEINLYNDSRKNQGNSHPLIRLKQRTQGGCGKGGRFA
jgi:hypothetical protein